MAWLALNSLPCEGQQRLLIRTILPPRRVICIGRKVSGAASLALARRTEPLHVTQLGRSRPYQFRRAEAEHGEPFVEQASRIRGVLCKLVQIPRRETDVLRHTRRLFRAESREIGQIFPDDRMMPPPLPERGDHVVDDRPVGLGCVRVHEALLRAVDRKCPRGTPCALRQINGRPSRLSGWNCPGGSCRDAGEFLYDRLHRPWPLRVWTTEC